MFNETFNIKLNASPLKRGFKFKMLVKSGHCTVQPQNMYKDLLKFISCENF